MTTHSLITQPLPGAGRMCGPRPRPIVVSHGHDVLDPFATGFRGTAKDTGYARRTIIFDQVNQYGGGEYRELLERCGMEPLNFSLDGDGVLLNPLDLSGPPLFPLLGQVGYGRGGLIKQMAARAAICAQAAHS